MQGSAYHVIKTAATWMDKKEELTKSFGVKETYQNLYHQAKNLCLVNVCSYFENLRYTLDKSNTKYEFDVSKSVEFSPKTNEYIILITFLNSISPNLASIIYSRQISTYR